MVVADVVNAFGVSIVQYGTSASDNANTFGYRTSTASYRASLYNGLDEWLYGMNKRTISCQTAFELAESYLNFDGLSQNDAVLLAYEASYYESLRLGGCGGATQQQEQDHDDDEGHHHAHKDGKVDSASTNGKSTSTSSSSTDYATKAAQFWLASLQANLQGRAESGCRVSQRFMGLVTEVGASSQTSSSGNTASYDSSVSSKAKAGMWYTTAAELGDVPSMFNLALLYQQGIVPESNKTKTSGYFSWGYTSTMANAETTQPDYQIAKEWFVQAAEQGHAPAQNSLGFLYANDYVSQTTASSYSSQSSYYFRGSYSTQKTCNYEIAKEYYEKAAKQGLVSAQFNLGALYQSGLLDLCDSSGTYATSQNKYAMAKYWYTLAADNGHTEAKTNLAALYRSGLLSSSSNSDSSSYVSQTDYDSNEIANKYYYEAASEGDPVAQTTLADLYASSSSSSSTGYIDQSSVEWYQKAAQQGYPSAQFNLGWLYEQGKVCTSYTYYNSSSSCDGTPDYTNAKYWYEQAAHQGDGSSQYRLGFLYDQGLIGTKSKGRKDYNMALTWYEMAAGQNHPDAQFRLGLLYERGLVGGNGQDYKTAALLYQKAAYQGHAEAMYRLGMLYQKDSDYSSALSWYTEASRQGYSGALCQLGYMYQSGKASSNGRPDYATAYQLFDQGAQESECECLTGIGDMYEEGQVSGNTKDYATAQYFFQLAINANCTSGLVRMGVLYENGYTGGGQDSDTAAVYYLQAANWGDADGDYHLGSLYENGLIGDGGKDIKTAKIWYTKAAALGNEKAAARLKSYSSSTTSSSAVRDATEHQDGHSINRSVPTYAEVGLTLSCLVVVCILLFLRLNQRKLSRTIDTMFSGSSFDRSLMTPLLTTATTSATEVESNRFWSQFPSKASKSNESMDSPSRPNKSYGSIDSPSRPNKSYGSIDSPSCPNKSYGSIDSPSRPNKSYGSIDSPSRPNKSYGSIDSPSHPNKSQGDKKASIIPIDSKGYLALDATRPTKTSQFNTLTPDSTLEAPRSKFLEEFGTAWLQQMEEAQKGMASESDDKGPTNSPTPRPEESPVDDALARGSIPIDSKGYLVLDARRPTESSQFYTPSQASRTHMTEDLTPDNSALEAPRSMFLDEYGTAWLQHMAEEGQKGMASESDDERPTNSPTPRPAAFSVVDALAIGPSRTATSPPTSSPTPRLGASPLADDLFHTPTSPPISPQDHETVDGGLSHQNYFDVLGRVGEDPPSPSTFSEPIPPSALLLYRKRKAIFSRSDNTVEL